MAGPLLALVRRSQRNEHLRNPARVRLSSAPLAAQNSEAILQTGNFGQTHI